MFLFLNNFYYICNMDLMDLKEAPKTNRRLFIISNYLTNSYKLDIYDKIDIKNLKGVLLESININSALIRFYEIEKVKSYGILRAYIWNIDNKKVERYITDLPDNEIKNRKKKYRKKEIEKEIMKLQKELNKLTKL